MRSTAEFTGVRVRGGARGTRRIGKVLRAVFFPESLHLAGYLVKRPDLLWMFKRSDRFFAADSFQIIDGRVVVDASRDSWDGAACKRLGLDWDEALILQGMPLIDAQGEKIGQVDAVIYDERSKQSEELLVSSGIGAKTLLGLIHVPRDAIDSCQDAQLILKAGVSIEAAEGGLAAKAGEQVAVVTHAVKDKVDNANEAVGRAVEKAGKGMEKLGLSAGKAVGKVSKSASKTVDNLGANAGKALGKQVKRTSGMFKGFRDEYKKARGKKPTDTKRQ